MKPLVVDFGKVGLHTPRLRVVQVIAGATASCADRAGVTVAASFEGGQLRAVSVTGAGADCVRRAVVAASTGVSCQFQLTFGG